MQPDDAVRSNCLVWALRRYCGLLVQWLRAGRPRGREPAIRIRTSQLEPWWVLHFQAEHAVAANLWMREEWVPLDDRPLPLCELWRALWAPGRIRRTEVSLFPATDPMQHDEGEDPMATGSQAQARQRLDAAGYTTGLPQHEPRCSGCTHVDFSAKLLGGTAHDRYCKLLQAGVKTHGHCRMHAASGVQR